ncbi:uncharacterized protein LOC126744782 [Anthonomus grandis grandis]|uniref:uncharacterized protein LOC126744782 n=1 Tax=Anthonomus grandis grandis TaxID=2921223 RepID=UPI002165EF8A|nr:uncharacterized protein LOC126744782 [Anthonomus grandis grandis]
MVSHTRTIQILKTYHGKCKNHIKSLKRLTEEKKALFLRQSEVLFDICSCKCKDLLHLCKCSRESKVPKEEHAFLLDRRGERKMLIGGVDLVRTLELKKKLDRKRKSLKPFNKLIPSCDQPQKEVSSSAFTDFEERYVSPVKHNVEDLPSTSQTSKKESVKRKRFPTLSKTADRYGVSDRAAAAIASAVLHDISSDVEVIDKSKLRRERQKLRDTLLREQTNLQLPALYFDGRKDKTLKVMAKAGKKYRKVVVEEHISVLKEPGSLYVGYTTPLHGTARSIERSISALLQSKRICSDELVAIGCDGTATNTGKNAGVIRLFEKKLQRPLQWIICMLHLNELPLRHLFNKLDGKTTGPHSYNGPIGKQLEKCEIKPVIEYEIIPSQLPVIKTEDLSMDQKYLYAINTAVITGNCPTDLAHKSPGKISHARWLTTANRILRLYVATIHPTENLCHLAQFIVKVYAPVWFQIKTHPSCKDGSRNLWKLIQNSRYLSKELRDVIDPVIQRNAYFFHPENLLLAMLTDEQKNIMELAARRILKARDSLALRRQLRIFEVPAVNFNASSYIDVIDWQENNNCDPPILRSFSNDDLKKLLHQMVTKI